MSFLFEMFCFGRVPIRDRIPEVKQDDAETAPPSSTTSSPQTSASDPAFRPTRMGEISFPNRPVSIKGPVNPAPRAALPTIRHVVENDSMRFLSCHGSRSSTMRPEYFI